MLFELPSFEYVDPRSIGEALQSLRHHLDSASVLAGGTDLLGLMKDRVQGPELKVPGVLVDVKTVAEMDRIDFDPKTGLMIGGAVTLSRLEGAERVRERYGILAQAARQIGTTQIRNRGTVGGNLCQRPRCLYFRHPHFPCRKKGGEKCFAAAGEHRYYHVILEPGRCVAAHPSDLAPPLVALGSYAVVASADGTREIPLTELFRPSSPFAETALQPGELLTSIRVPVPEEETRQVFLKSRIRKSSDFALASVAVVARLNKEVCEEIRIVLGGVSPSPYVAAHSMRLLAGRTPDETLLQRAADASVEAARPLRSNPYKVGLTKALVLRALARVWAAPADP